MCICGPAKNAPNSFKSHYNKIFQPFQITHKILDYTHCFDAIEPLLKKFATPETCQLFENAHIGTHHIEPFLDLIVVIGDSYCLIKGNYFDRDKNKKLDLVRIGGRVCHSIAHLFSSAKLLNNLKIVDLTSFKAYFNYQRTFAVLGYGIWTSQLIYNRIKKKHSDHFIADLSIQLSGLIMEAIPLIKKCVWIRSNFLVFNTLPYIYAIACAVHSYTFISHAMDDKKTQHAYRINTKILL